MKTHEEFRRFYQSELLPMLSELETLRQKAVRTFFIVVCVTAALVLAALGVLLPATGHPGFLLLLGIPAVTSLVAYSAAASDIRRKFKGSVMWKIVRFCDPALEYFPDSRIPRPQFEASRIFLRHIDRYNGEDRVTGKMGATAVDFSEVHAEYKTTTRDSKGHTHTQWHTIFKGIFFIADFNKHFQGRTVVLPDAMEEGLGFLGNLFQKLDFTRDELVKLEDPEFERLFVVYGTDQIEARYILSTSLMERIKNFRIRTGQEVYLSFVNSCVHVGVSTSRNMFEPRFFSSMSDYSFAEQLLDDLQFALGIVDELNLNTRIWTKK